MKDIKTSVIAAFYNNIQYLKLVLAGFSRQSDMRYEFIIADDGSALKVTEEIREISGKYPFTIKHLWHEDQGWRKNIILNHAIIQSEYDYLVFIDADCIPHRHFIREHLENRVPGKILSGRRINLSERLTNDLTPEKVLDGYMDKNILKWLFLGAKSEITHAEKGLYLPFLRSFLTKKNKGLLGCNFSLFKDDLLSINGFDERYLAPTVGEDTEIEYRAALAGIKIKSVRNLAIQYHLYHPKLSRENNNKAIFEDTKSKGYIKTPFGIVKEKKHV